MKYIKTRDALRGGDVFLDFLAGRRPPPMAKYSKAGSSDRCNT